jgi:hypothetical protein
LFELRVTRSGLALKPLLDWIGGKPQNLKRSLVMSHFDGTKFGVIAQLTHGAFFLVFRKN